MTQFEAQSLLPCTPAEAYAWHARPGAFQRLMPPWERMRLISRKGGLEAGAETLIEMRLGPIPFRWLAVHEEPVPDRSFVDVQEEGPFRSWRHQHLFEESAPKSCRLIDRIDYRLRGGILGRLLAGSMTRRQLMRTFEYRHETTKRDLELHEAHSGPALRVAIVGASGLLGETLSAILGTGGHEVREIGRRTDGLKFDQDAGLDHPEVLEGFDAVVHLAGENIAGGRWTEERMEAIRASRVDGTRALVRSLAGLKSPPRIFICASAAGYYGASREGILDENSAPGDDFLARTCIAWEEAAAGAQDFGARVVNLRFGVIVSPRGGALKKMLPPFKMGVGGKLGSGEQPMSWISIDDAAGAVLHALRHDEIAGPVNVVSPQPVTNAEWTKKLGRTLGRPTILPMPAFAARLAFGKMADAILLNGTRIAPKRLQETGFRFRDPELEPCLARLLGKKKPSDQTS